MYQEKQSSGARWAIIALIVIRCGSDVSLELTAEATLLDVSAVPTRKELRALDDAAAASNNNESHRLRPCLSRDVARQCARYRSSVTTPA